MYCRVNSKVVEPKEDHFKSVCHKFALWVTLDGPLHKSSETPVSFTRRNAFLVSVDEAYLCK